MRLLNKFLYRKVVKAIDHRQKSLIKLMEICSAKMDANSTQSEEAEKWSRMYWDAWVREEELSSLRSYLEDL